VIRRDGPRRPTAQALTPTYKGEELPPWTPRAPRGGWTPSSAWSAALDYAEEYESELFSLRLLASSAYRELLKATPGLHRADVVARLQGNDPRKDYLK
jgi:hypothetical protein